MLLLWPCVPFAGGLPKISYNYPIEDVLRSVSTPSQGNYFAHVESLRTHSPQVKKRANRPRYYWSGLSERKMFLPRGDQFRVDPPYPDF